MCYDNSGYCDDDDHDDKFFEWYDGYKKRKAQQASMKEELCLLLRIHQDTGIGVCQKMKNKRQKNYGCKKMGHFCI